MIWDIGMVEILRLFSRLFFLASTLHAVRWLGATQYTFVRLLLVFIPVTPLPHFTTSLLSAQRASPLRFVGINKQVSLIPKRRDLTFFCCSIVRCAPRSCMGLLIGEYV